MFVYSISNCLICINVNNFEIQEANIESDP